MNSNKYFLILIVTLCCSSRSLAQNILTSSIEWTCTSTFIAYPGTLVDETTRVVSSPQQIIWYDAENNIKHTLSITNSEGTWTNISHNGSMLFNVTSGDDTGIVKFYRVNGVTKVRIHTVQQGDHSIYELTVSTTDNL